MKKIIPGMLFMFMTVCAAAQTGFREPVSELDKNQKTDHTLALAGDYNAMRNIAFSYASTGGGGAKSKIAGCAWYLLIPPTHKPKFNVGDTGNIQVYCNKLSLSEFDTAYEYAFRTLAPSIKTK